MNSISMRAGAWLALALTVVAPFAAVCTAQGTDAGRVRILRIVPTVVWKIPGGGRGDPTAPRMSKYLDEEPVPSRARFSISWAPPAAGLDYGLTVLLEYRLAPDGYAGTCRAAVAGPLRGEQRTLLEVPLDGRRVAAWRVRLLSGATVLDEQQSKNWKE